MTSARSSTTSAQPTGSHPRRRAFQRRGPLVLAALAAVAGVLGAASILRVPEGMLEVTGGRLHATGFGFRPPFAPVLLGRQFDPAVKAAQPGLDEPGPPGAPVGLVRRLVAVLRAVQLRHGRDERGAGQTGALLAARGAPGAVGAAGDQHPRVAGRRDDRAAADVLAAAPLAQVGAARDRGVAEPPDPLAPLAHPAITAIVAGVRSVDHFDDYPRLLREPIPDALWAELRAERLIAPGAPVPTAGAGNG